MVTDTQHRPSHDRWMVTPWDPDYLPPALRWCRVCGELDSHANHGAPTVLEPARVHATTYRYTPRVAS